MREVRFRPRGRRGQMLQEALPKGMAFRVVGYTRAGDVSENPVGFIAPRHPGQMHRIVMGGTGQLGGAANGGGMVGIFSGEEQDCQFVIGKSMPARVHDGFGMRSVVMAAPSGSGHLQGGVQVIDSQPAGLADEE